MKSSDSRTNRSGIVFLLIFIFLAAGIIVISYFAYRNYEQNYRVGVEHQLSAVAELKVHQLVQYRNERLGDASVLFNNPAFSNLVRRFIEKTNYADARRQLQIWLDKTCSGGQYDRVSLLDTHGIVRMSVPDTWEPNSATVQKKASEVLLSREVTIQDFYRDEHNQKIYLALLVPIIDNTDRSHKLGVIVIRIDPATYLFPFIQTWPVLSRTSETLIARREGNDVLFLNELRFQKNTALKLRLSLSDEHILAVKAVLGQKGIVEGVDYRGVPVIGDVRSVPDSPWFLVTHMDRSEVYETVRARLWLVIILVISLITIAGTTLALVWRRQRSRFYREQYESTEALRASETRYRRLFEAARDGILILDAETGKIVDVNPFLIEMLGYSQEQMSEKVIWEIGCFKDIAANQDMFLELQQKSYVRYEDLPLATADGRLIDVEFISNVYSVGHHKVIQCNIRDITERKQAQEKANHLAAIVRSSEDAIVGKTLDGIITSWNKGAERLYGFTESEVLGKPISLLIPPGNEDELPNSLDRLKSSGRVEQYETVRRRKDGREIQVLMTISPIRDPEGKIIAASTVARDITERKAQEARTHSLLELSERSRQALLSILEDEKRAEEEIRKLNAELEQRVIDRTAQLEAANKELEAFSYSVSHDLRAPLRSIDGFSLAMLEDYAPKLDDQAKNYLNRLRGAAQSMAALIDDLLDLSRVTRREMHTASVDMSALATGIIRRLRGAEPDRRVEFTAMPDLIIGGDSHLLGIMLENLLGNAWKFTSHKSMAKIEFGRIQKSGETIFFVHDNGAGFDTKYANKLFVPFQRLHNPSEFPGTGIGLATVRRIVSRHGGRVWAEGQVDEGATFYFTLQTKERQ